MKKLSAFLVAAVLLACGSESPAAQSGSTQAEMSVTVKQSCRFSSSTLTLSFGRLDPSSSSPAIASVNTEFWCTRGTVATLVSNDGLHFMGERKNMKHAATEDYIPYTLDLRASSLTGGGKNTPRELAITGTIANSDYVNARVGNYSDTVELRITP